MCQALWQNPGISPAKSGPPLKTLPWTDKFCHFVRFGGGPSQLLTGLAIRASSVGFTNLRDLMASGTASPPIQRHLGPRSRPLSLILLILMVRAFVELPAMAAVPTGVTLDDQSAIQQGSALWR
jgi:hypothetical protein